MKKRFSIAIVLLVLTIAFASDSLCAETDTEKMIKQVEAKVAKVKTFKADMTMAMEMMGQKMVSEGNLAFKEPDKMRMDMTTSVGAMKVKSTVISDGKTFWTYQPMMKMVMKMDIKKVADETGEDIARQQMSDISKPFEDYERDSIRYIGTEKLDETTTNVFEAAPKEKIEFERMPFVPAKMKLWIGADDGFIRKVVTLDEEGKEMMSMSFTNIQMNVEIADTQFEFKPPKGAQVMDMTESTINMYKQMKEGEEEGEEEEEEEEEED